MVDFLLKNKLLLEKKYFNKILFLKNVFLFMYPFNYPNF